MDPVGSIHCVLIPSLLWASLLVAMPVAAVCSFACPEPYRDCLRQEIMPLCQIFLLCLQYNEDVAPKPPRKLSQLIMQHAALPFPRIVAPACANTAEALQIMNLPVLVCLCVRCRCL